MKECLSSRINKLANKIKDKEAKSKSCFHPSCGVYVGWVFLHQLAQSKNPSQECLVVWVLADYRCSQVDFIWNMPLNNDSGPIISLCFLATMTQTASIFCSYCKVQMILDRNLRKLQSKQLFVAFKLFPSHIDHRDKMCD